MKSLIKLVDNVYRLTNEEIQQELIVKNLCDSFAGTLNQKQCNTFVKILIARDKLENLKIKNYISTTHKVCKEAFKLR